MTLWFLTWFSSWVSREKSLLTYEDLYSDPLFIDYDTEGDKIQKEPSKFREVDDDVMVLEEDLDAYFYPIAMILMESFYGTE